MKLPFFRAGRSLVEVTKPAAPATSAPVTVVNYADDLNNIEAAPQGLAKAEAILTLFRHMKGDDFYKVFCTNPNTELQNVMREAGSNPNAKTIAQLCQDPDSGSYFTPTGLSSLQSTDDPKKADAAWANAFKLINAFAMSGSFDKSMGFKNELTVA